MRDTTNNKTVEQLEEALDRWMHTRDYLADSLEDCEATIADIYERLRHMRDTTNNKTVEQLEEALDRWMHTRDYLADSLEDCEATIADIYERLRQYGVKRPKKRRRQLADIGVSHGDLLEFVDFRKSTPVVLAEVPVINPYSNKVRFGSRKMSYYEAAGVSHGDLLEFVDFRKSTPVVLAEVPVINPYSNKVRFGSRKMSYYEAARQLSGNKTAADPLAYFHWNGRRLRDWFDELEAEDKMDD